MLCDVASGARRNRPLISTTSASGGWSRQPVRDGRWIDTYIGVEKEHRKIKVSALLLDNCIQHTQKREAIFDRRAKELKRNKKISLCEIIGRRLGSRGRIGSSNLAY